MKSNNEYNGWHEKCVLMITMICVFSSVESQAVISLHNVCLTDNCNETASSVLNSMKGEVNPCDDFYEFVCGNVPKGKDALVRLPTLDKFHQKVKKRVKFIIEEKYQGNESRPLKLVKTMYKLCTKNNPMKDMQQKLFNYTNKLGGWPVLQRDAWSKERFDWAQYVEEFYKLGYAEDSLISITVDVDRKSNSKFLIHVGKANRKLYRTAMMMNLAVKHVANMTKAREDLTKSVEFEAELAKISQSVPEEKLRNLTELYNPMTINELETNFTSIPWRKLLNKFLAPSGYKLTQDELVIVKEPSFIFKLNELLNKTDERILSNYIMSHFVHYLNDIVNHFKGNCANIVSEYFIDIIDAEYLNKNFDKGMKSKAIDMFAKLKAELTKVLQTENWLDERTRANALEKLASMKALLAYPDNLLNNSRLEEYYEQLEIREEDYLQSVINIQIFNNKLSIDNLRKQFDETDWKSYSIRPTTMDTIYNPRTNTIIIPAAVIQAAYFSQDLPTYMNFGALGAIIGHKIMHGFDSNGIEFDKDGNLANWWANDTRNKFLDKTKCLVDQYNQYESHESAEVSTKVNGTLTLAENIAENGGIKLAYRAYKESARQNIIKEERMSGSLESYTPRQMFWISYANTWCGKYRPDNIKNAMNKFATLTFPSKFRVLGAISNMPEFFEDFDCSPNSKMIRKNPCVVW